MVWFLRFNRGRIWFCSANFPNWGNTNKSTCQIAKSPALPKRWTENSRPSETPQRFDLDLDQRFVEKKKLRPHERPVVTPWNSNCRKHKMRTKVISTKGCIQEGLMGQLYIYLHFLNFGRPNCSRQNKKTANVALSFCTNSSWLYLWEDPPDVGIFTSVTSLILMVNCREIYRTYR